MLNKASIPSAPIQYHSNPHSSYLRRETKQKQTLPRSTIVPTNSNITHIVNISKINQ